MVALILMMVCPVVAADTDKDTEKRVLILPLTLHAEKKVPFLSQGIVDMLASRIARSATVIHSGSPESGKSPRKWGEEMNAGYVVSGSVTLFENTVSTDAILTRVDTGAVVVRFNQLGHSSGDVLAHVNAFATQVTHYLDAAPESSGTVAAGPLAPSSGPSPQPAPVMIPATATPSSQPAAPTPPASGTPEPAQAASKTGNLWVSPPFKGVINALTTADVTGGGTPNIVFLHNNQVVVMAKAGSRLDRVAAFDLSSPHTVVGLDAGDINQNQRAEIFVTRLAPNNQLDSLVLEWDGSALSPIATNQPWYFRVIPVPRKGPVLLGQRRGVRTQLDTGGLYTDAFFMPGIFELAPQGDGYAPGARLAIPNDHNLYQTALGPVFNDGIVRAIAYSAGDSLRIYDPAGNLHWADSETLGGNPFFLSVRSQTDRHTQGRCYLSQRLIPVDLDGDGAIEVMTVHNRDLTRGTVERFRKYTRGRILALRWNAVSLKPVWRGEEITGYISDFSVSDLDGDGKPEAVYAMVTASGWLQTQTSRIVVEAFGRLEQP